MCHDERNRATWALVSGTEGLWVRHDVISRAGHAGRRRGGATAAAPDVEVDVRPVLVPEPMAPPSPYIARPRLDEALDGEWRVALLVAPPGYGKSVLARSWVERSGARAATVSVDGLGDDEALTRVLDAAHALFPGTSARSNDIRALVAAIGDGTDDTSGGATAALVVDCPRPLLDSPVWDLIAEIVDGSLGRVRLVVMCQLDPPLPVVRWRSEGIVRILRESGLRFGDHEAIAVAAAFGRALDARAVGELNRRVEGWPLAFTLALMAIGDEWDDREEPEIFVDALVAAVVDQLSPRHREIALALSVFEWFDDALATAMVGPDAKPVLAELRRRHLVEVAETGLGLRFHRLVRELLDAELSWHDPERHAELHQHAAEYWLQQGKWQQAYRHLGSLRDRAAVHHLVVEPALALVDSGDRAGLGRLLSGLPRTSTIDDAPVALDLATVSFFAGDRRLAMRWVERAEMVGLGDDAIVARAHSTRAILALMDGRLLDASAEAEKFLAVRSRSVPGGPLEERFGLVAARLELLRCDVVAAQDWIDGVGAQSNPTVVRDVTLPGLQAWHDGLVGLTQRSLDIATEALARAAALGCGPHHGAFDATVAAAWACLRMGNLPAAEQHAARALADGTHLGYDWNIVRSADVAARVHLAARRPAQALATIAAARKRLSVPDSELAVSLVLPEAAASWRLGQADAAVTLLDGMPDEPATLLLRAAIALEADDVGVLDELLDGSESWLLPDRIGAALLTAVAGGDDERLALVVEDASATGLMLPFLGQGRRVETALLGLSLEGVHPTLIDHLRSPDHGRSRRGRTASLTARERSILDLLPSHLTYAEIAERLAVSVNTVKGNLKSIYRKLEVSGRADAVDVARGAGII